MIFKELLNIIIESVNSSFISSLRFLHRTVPVGPSQRICNVQQRNLLFPGNRFNRCFRIVLSLAKYNLNRSPYLPSS